MAWLLCQPSGLICGSCSAACMTFLMLNTHESDFENTLGQPEAGMPGLTAPLYFLFILFYKYLRHLLKLEIFPSLNQTPAVVNYHIPDWHSWIFMELFLPQVWIFNRYTSGYFYYSAILQKQLSPQICFALLVKSLCPRNYWYEFFLSFMWT